MRIGFVHIAVELLLAGVPIERVSILLDQSIKITEASLQPVDAAPGRSKWS